MTTYPDELADLDPFTLLVTEVERLDRHFARAGQQATWDSPTGCTEWSTRDMLAHVRHNNRYDVACLDDRIPDLFTEAGANGVTDLETFNAWGVRLGREREPGDILTEWREVRSGVIARLRERGRDGTLTTMVGPYSAGLQALHLAVEHAVHSDDVGAEVGDDERDARLAWRVRAARFILREEKKDGATIEERGGGNHVRRGDEEATLSDEELVLASTGRLGTDRLPSKALRTALNMY